MRANPVIVKELRGRMRGWRASMILVIYLAVLSVITWLVYLAARDLNQNAYMYGGSQNSFIGKIIFGVLVGFQVLLVGLITPAFTAGSITSEREQKTYDLLVTTLLHPRSIIFGKLGSALAFVLLLILSIAPIESLAFMFGGVSPEEIVLSQVVVLVAALMFASVGMFWSSLLRSSVASNVLTYGTIIFQMIGIPFLYYIGTVLVGAYNYNPTTTPVTQTEGFVYMTGVTLSTNPMIAMVLSDTLLSSGDPLFIYTSTRILNGHTLLVVSPWLIFCVEALLLSAVLIFASTRLVRPIRGGARQAAPPRAVIATQPPLEEVRR